jgi:tRNA splicing ligase
MNTPKPIRHPRSQRGITLFGLMFWATLVGFAGYVLVRTLPTVNEYLTIQRAVKKVAEASPSTVAETRQAFDNQKSIEYSIEAISGKDLIVTKENDKVVVAFAYDKLIPIYGPVNLLIKYEGRSK